MRTSSALKQKTRGGAKFAYDRFIDRFLPSHVIRRHRNEDQRGGAASRRQMQCILAKMRDRYRFFHARKFEDDRLAGYGAPGGQTRGLLKTFSKALRECWRQVNQFEVLWRHALGC